MMVPWKALDGRHVTTFQYTKGAEQKRHRLAEKEMWESAEMAYQAYVRSLATVKYFKYLGQVLTAADNNWPVVVENLWNKRIIWAWLARIMGREGTSPRVSGMFFKTVVQAVLLFGRIHG